MTEKDIQFEVLKGLDALAYSSYYLDLSKDAKEAIYLQITMLKDTLEFNWRIK